MPFNINTIKSMINKHGGLARPNKFKVIIPTSQISSLGVMDLSLMCESTNLPGLNLQTNEFRYNGYGMTEKRPYMSAVNDTTMLFYADADSNVVSHFHDWLKLINSFNDSKDTFKYPDDYVVDIDIGTIENRRHDIKDIQIIKSLSDNSRRHTSELGR